MEIKGLQKENEISLGALGMGVQQVGGSGGITQETDPTVPQWAKQPNKPTYDYSEIENTPNLGDFASKTEVKEEIAGLINSAPETLDTLGEIAKAVQDNEEVVDVLNQAIGEKASKTELQQVDQKTTNNATAIEEVNQKLNDDYVKNTDRDTFVKDGITENSITLTDEEKTKACNWLGALLKPTTLDPYGREIVVGLNANGNLISIPTSGAGALLKSNASAMLDVPSVEVFESCSTDKTCTPKKWVLDQIANAGGGTKLYRYHVNIHILSNGMIPVYVEFDTFSQNADLFSNNNTAIENYNILHSLYASEKIPVVYKCSFDGYNIEGSVSLTFNASSNGMNELMGCGYDIDKVTHQYIIDSFSSSQISTFEFTRFEQ